MFIEGRGVTFLIWAFEPAIGNFTRELLETLVEEKLKKYCFGFAQ